MLFVILGDIRIELEKSEIIDKTKCREFTV